MDLINTQRRHSQPYQFCELRSAKSRGNTLVSKRRRVVINNLAGRARALHRPGPMHHHRCLYHHCLADADGLNRRSLSNTLKKKFVVYFFIQIIENLYSPKNGRNNNELTNSTNKQQ